MISLLIAIFGKDRIPNGIRYVFLIIGLSALVYRLYKLKRAHQQLKEAEAIQMVMQQKMAEEAEKKQVEAAIID